MRPWEGTRGCSHKVTCHSEDRSGSSSSFRPTPMPLPPLEGLLLGTVPQWTCVPLHPLALPSGAAGIATIISQVHEELQVTGSQPPHSSATVPACQACHLEQTGCDPVSKARFQRSPRAKTCYTQPKSLSFNVCSGIWKGCEDMSFMVIMSSFLEWEGPGWYFFCLPWKTFFNGFSVKEMAHHRLRFHE